MEAEEARRAAERLILERRSPQTIAAERSVELRQAAIKREGDLRESTARHFVGFFGMPPEAARRAAGADWRR